MTLSLSPLSFNCILRLFRLIKDNFLSELFIRMIKEGAETKRGRRSKSRVKINRDIKITLICGELSEKTIRSSNTAISFSRRDNSTAGTMFPAQNLVAEISSRWRESFSRCFTHGRRGWRRDGVRGCTRGWPAKRGSFCRRQIWRGPPPPPTPRPPSTAAHPVMWGARRWQGGIDSWAGDGTAGWRHY